MTQKEFSGDVDAVNSAIEYIMSYERQGIHAIAYLEDLICSCGREFKNLPEYRIDYELDVELPGEVTLITLNFLERNDVGQDGYYDGDSLVIRLERYSASVMNNKYELGHIKSCKILVIVFDDCECECEEDCECQGDVCGCEEPVVPETTGCGCELF